MNSVSELLGKRKILRAPGSMAMAAICFAAVQLVLASTADALSLTAVYSRKTHGSSGTFDLPVDVRPDISGAVTVEPRALGAGHKIVFRFDAPVLAVGGVTVRDESLNAVTSASHELAGTDVIVSIASLADNKRVLITVENVNGTALDISAALAFQLGDLNDSLTADANDLSAGKARSGQAATESTFKSDVNTSGYVNAVDIAAIKARHGTIAPAGVTPSPQTSAMVTLDPAVPAAAAALVTLVSSPLGTGAIDTNLPIIQSGGTGLSLVLALDDLKNIVLGAQGNGGSIVLSAESTAVVLVRLALGPVPAGISAAQVDAQIRAAAEFPVLVAAINTALAGGQPPVLSSAVQESAARLVAVIDLTPPAQAAVFFDGVSAKTGLARQVGAMSLLVSDPCDPGGSGGFVSAPVPCAIVRDSTLTALSVDLSDGGGVLKNKMPIAWAAFTEAPDGTPLAPPMPAAGGEVYANQLLLPARDGLLAKSYSVANNNGNGYKLTLRQSYESRSKNMIDIGRGLYKVTMDYLFAGFTPPDCEEAIFGGVLDPLKVNEFASLLTADAFLDYLKSADIPSTLSKCFGKARFPDKTAFAYRNLIAGTAKWLSGIKSVISAAEYASLGLKLGLAVQYWDAHIPALKVCEVEGTFYGFNVVRCPASFQFSPPALRLAEGAEVAVNVSAVDFANATTLVPKGAAYSSDSATTALINAANRNVKAIGVGLANVKVDYPFSGATATLPVQVVRPQVSPPAVTMYAGETGTLRLTDAGGQDVIVTGTGMVWLSSNPAIAKVDPLANLLSTNSMTITGVAAGDTTITAYNPSSGYSAVATVHVNAREFDCPPPAYFSGSCILTPSVDTTFVVTASATNYNALPGATMWLYIYVDGQLCNAGADRVLPVAEGGTSTITDSCTVPVMAGSRVVVYGQGANHISDGLSFNIVAVPIVNTP